MKVYVIVKDNFENRGAEVEIFATIEKAKEIMKIIRDNNRDKDEFEETEMSCSWWDANYSEYNTYVEIQEHEVQ